MNYKRLNCNTVADEDDVLSALCGQLSSIKNVMNELVRKRENRETFDKGSKSGFKFTKQEIKAMPNYIKKIFIANNYIVNYRITSNGYYEARIRRKNMYIEASGRDFETMRRRFIDRLTSYYDRSDETPQQQIKEVKTADKVLFTDYAEEWLKIKEQTTKPSTFKEYERSYRVDLAPTFTKRTLSDITRSDLQTYLFGIIKEGKHRKAEKLALMLNCIFDMVAEDNGKPSPMNKVVVPNYEAKKGSALTYDEEKTLVNHCIAKADKDTASALLVLLYTGLRRSKLKTLKIIDGPWLECETSKERMGKNIVKRQIPFTPMMKRVLPYIDFEKARNVNLNSLNTAMKRIFPNHHLHELRYTFITRCKESGVHGEAVLLWDGHEEDKTIHSSKVDRGYTDFSKEFQLKEATKVNYLEWNFEETEK